MSGDTRQDTVTLCRYHWSTGNLFLYRKKYKKEETCEKKLCSMLIKIATTNEYSYLRIQQK